MAAAAVPSKDTAADRKTGDDAAQASAVEWLHAYLPRDSDVWACQFRRHDIATVHDVLLLVAQDLHEMLRQRTRACVAAAAALADAAANSDAAAAATADSDDDDESADALVARFMGARAHYVHTAAPYSTRVDAGGHAVALTADLLADLQAVTPRRQSLLPPRPRKAMMAQPR